MGRRNPELVPLRAALREKQAPDPKRSFPCKAELLVQSGAFGGPRTGSKESAASVREAEAHLTRIESCRAPLHPLRQRAVKSRHSTQER